MGDVMPLSRETTESLWCELGSADLLERGRQLAEAIKAVQDEEERQASQKKSMKDSLEALQNESERLARIVREEREERPVRVAINFDEAAGMVHKVRLDTGEVFASRQMTDDERQRALPFASRKVN